jgi:hypothetical protein
VSHIDTILEFAQQREEFTVGDVRKAHPQIPDQRISDSLKTLVDQQYLSRRKVVVSGFPKFIYKAKVSA